MSSEGPRGSWALRFVVALAASTTACSVPRPAVVSRASPTLNGPWSRARCVAAAIEAAPTAEAWRARLDHAHALAAQCSAWPNPSIHLEWEDLAAPQGVPIQTTVSILESLSALATRSAHAAEAEGEREAVAHDVDAERIWISGQVLHEYDHVLIARARTKLARDAVIERQKVADAVVELAAAGEAAYVDVSLASNDLDHARTDLAESIRSERETELALAFALGFERPVALELSEPLQLEVDDRDLESMLRIAADTRPELAAALARCRTRCEASENTHRRLSFLPTMTVGRRSADGTISGVASIEVELPLFDRGDAAADASDAAALLASADVARVARDVTQQVVAARERSIDAHAALDRARSTVERRRHLVEDCEILFGAGEASLTQVQAAHVELVTARKDLLDATAAAAAARVDLEAALGRPASP